jgi:hypothetical protein
MNNPPFFIVGIGRSGTTLLRLMLHNHPRLAIPYESHFITDYQGRESEYGDLNQDENLHQLIHDILNEELLLKWDHSFSQDEVYQRVKSRTLTGVFDAVYQSYANAKGKTRWGDKSDYLDRMHLINQVFPDARFIHIIRDGRDVANSVLKMSWGPKDIVQAAEWWHEHIRLGRCMGSILGAERYMEVRFEDLVSQPVEQLKRICAFLQEDYDPAMLEYHKSSAVAIPSDRKDQHYNADSPPKTARIFAWKTEMSPAHVAIFNSIAAPSLKAMNYEIQAPSITGKRLQIAKAFVYLKRML